MATTKKKEKKSDKQIYKCKSCGTTTTKKGHLCNPVPYEPIVECELCGQTAEDARHVCVPVLTNLKFQCGNCGRVASKKNELCKPAALKKPKKDKKK